MALKNEETKADAPERLKKVLENAGKAVFFGGAGVSTESGIPDFRSENGIYRAKTQYGFSPETLLSHSFFLKHPDVFYDFYRSTMIYREAKPNAAHTALAELENRGILSAVVTQNIDGLHQLAGSRNIYELHGSVARNHCMRCGASYSLDEILAASGVPLCRCGGMIKPDVVLYEEPLDENVWRGAAAAVSAADVLIVGGTSLSVYPAAGLVQLFSGRTLVLINKSPTPYDSRADLLICGSIGQVLSRAVSLFGTNQHS